MSHTIISASPHLHAGKTTNRIMYDVLIALIPAFLVSVYVFGYAALLLTSVAVISCVGFEYLIQKYLLKISPTIYDGSAWVTGVLLAFNLPADLPLWMVVLGSFVAIGIAKQSFGGLGFNIFNPALVGRVFLLISFPVQMTTWPKAFYYHMNPADAITGATPLGILKEGIRNGNNIPEIYAHIPTHTDMWLGFTGGSLGEISALALLIGAVYLLIRKVITWHIPLSMLASIALISGLFWWYDATHYASPVFHLLSGGAVLGAFFMATDMVTSPMSRKGMLVFGFGIGFISMIIRLFGAYPEGVSFAILLMNALVPLINKSLKPRRFGSKIKHKIF